MVIGCSGSGKTTFATELGRILGREVIHLDFLYWNPGWIETEKMKWKGIVEEVVSRDQWVIDGNYGGTIDIRLANADAIIFLDISRYACLWRVLKRRILYHGKTRPDLPAGCPEKLDWEFIRWIWTFPRRSRPMILEKLKYYANKKVIITLRSNKDIESSLKKLKSSFKRN
jgi:adenylate kinase family enzyme